MTSQFVRIVSERIHSQVCFSMTGGAWHEGVEAAKQGVSPAENPYENPPSEFDHELSNSMSTAAQYWDIGRRRLEWIDRDMFGAIKLFRNHIPADWPEGVGKISANFDFTNLSIIATNCVPEMTDMLLSDQALKIWIGLWDKAFKNFDEYRFFNLPLRLMRAIADYRKQPNRRILLQFERLTERPFLSQLLDPPAC